MAREVSSSSMLGIHSSSVISILRTSPDGKYISTGGEGDLVQGWTMEERKIVACGEGHNSWVSGVAIDSYWSATDLDGTGESVLYRFGSVGQDTQLLLWDLVMDELIVPLCCCPPGGSPTLSSGSPSSHWDDICPMGTLQPPPSTRDVPKLSPLVAHHVHMDPLSVLMFTSESVVTICREGHIKIWVRPGNGESNPTNTSEAVVNAINLKDRLLPTSIKSSSTISYKQPASVFIRN